jgi:hypothetical protein
MIVVGVYFTTFDPTYNADKDKVGTNTRNHFDERNLQLYTLTNLTYNCCIYNLNSTLNIYLTLFYIHIHCFQLTIINSVIY